MTSGPDHIDRPILSEQVKDRIMQWILEGDLSPGERIVETRVARELGTSQAPVREALRDLATLGFVEMQPYRGARVRKPTEEEIAEALDVRAELEALAGRLAADRRTSQCVADLITIRDAMHAAADRNDAHDLAIASTEFHRTIVAAAQNPTLERIWSMLQPFSTSYLTASVPGVDLHWLADRHNDILDAIKQRDPDRASAALRSHATAVLDLIHEEPHVDHRGAAAPR